jgi:hypothetical protein
VDDLDETVTIETWWLGHRLASGTRADRIELERGESTAALRARAASEAVRVRLDAGGPPALAFVLELLAAAPDERGVALVGAGPLEDLIHQHGDALAALIDETARQDPAFAACLGSVCVDLTSLPSESRDRLARWVLPAG